MPTNPHPCVIVDDNEIDRLTALAHARQYPSLSVIGVFESATDALLFLQNQPVDVLLLDIDMPDLSGLELRGQSDAGACLRVHYVLPRLCRWRVSPSMRLIIWSNPSGANVLLTR